MATGAEPVRLPGSGPQRVLRTLDDALELRSVLRPGLRLAIVGAGWIGAELATAAAAQGGQVTVLEAGPALEAIAARHLEAEVLGISLVTNLASGVSTTPLDHAEVLAAGAAAAPGLGTLLRGVIEDM